MDANAHRQLAIKTKACARTLREMQSYEQEVETELARAARLEEEGADEADIRKQHEVAAESAQMIPNTRKRLAKYVDELAAMIAELPDEDNDDGADNDDGGDDDAPDPVAEARRVHTECAEALASAAADEAANED